MWWTFKTKSMASYQDLELDWSVLCQDGTECWTAQDLQLAAELGKTLLERNKELENSLKQHQNVIEDQTQEIEYLTKQTVALREVNDSRLRIYEQLEVSIQDLERANHRLALENSSDKKHIKTLTSNIETLETKCEDLQSVIDDLQVQVDVLKRRAQKTNDNCHYVMSCNTKLRRVSRELDGVDDVDSSVSPDSSVNHIEIPQCVSTPKLPYKRLPSTQKTSPDVDKNTNKDDNTADPESGVEQLSQLLSQLRETRTQCNRDQRRISELEEQLATMVQQNQTLENQLMQMHNKDEDMKSMHEELTTLEEVRQGQMCSRCLRSVDRNGDDMSLSLCDEPEDDDASMLEALMNHSQHRSSFSMDVQDHVGKTSSPSANQGGNLYRDLVQKYEALLEIHRHPASRNSNSKANPMSLQEEMQMSGDFNALSIKDTDEESGHGDSLQHKKTTKTISHTPTDFSEAETSSSGFSDETSNKCTQTEGRPGSFLCTIADGEDCKFSIYDDASPIDSRFRNRPEYRELFKEIFTILKKAAENKDEGEELPLLDDHTPAKGIPKVPPVTPSNDNLPDFPDNLTDDTQSVLSSTMSELSTSQAEPPTVIENTEQVQTGKEPQPSKKVEEECVLTPLVRQPLEYLTVGVNIRKRSSSRRKNKFSDRSDSPITHIVGSPKITYSNKTGSGRKRREIKTASNETDSCWNGHTLQFWSSNRNTASPTPATTNNTNKGYFEYKPSPASQDLHKLKRLDLSYAEVLRNADNKKRELQRSKRK